jgi:hypothetical protein
MIALKVGDKVRVKDSVMLFGGEVGVIRGFREMHVTYPINVLLPPSAFVDDPKDWIYDTDLWMAENELELIEGE